MTPFLKTLPIEPNPHYSSLSLLTPQREKKYPNTYHITSMTIFAEEPLLSRLDRLDNLLRHLEEKAAAATTAGSKYRDSKSSSGSTEVISGMTTTITSEELEKCCRPLEEVVVETEIKGSLVQRVARMEDRVLKLCLQLEEEIVAEKKCTQINRSTSNNAPETDVAMTDITTCKGTGKMGEVKGAKAGTPRRKRGLRGLLRSCVEGG
ncbi:hypothetical protein Droror1_Dr00024452 [Drosera rotundifolia]